MFLSWYFPLPELIKRHLRDSGQEEIKFRIQEVINSQSLSIINICALIVTFISLALSIAFSETNINLGTYDTAISIMKDESQYKKMNDQEKEKLIENITGSSAQSLFTEDENGNKTSLLNSLLENLTQPAAWLILFAIYQIALKKARLRALYQLLI